MFHTGQQKEKMSQTTRRFLLIFIPMALLLVLVSFLLERTHSRAEETVAREREAVYLNEQKKNIDTTFATIFSDLQLLVHHQEIHALFSGDAHLATSALAKEFAAFSAYKKFTIKSASSMSPVWS